MRPSADKLTAARALDAAQNISGRFIKVAGLVALFSAAYLIWGIAGKSVFSLPSIPIWAQKRVISNVNIATTAFELSAVIFIICLVIRNFSDDILGYVLSLAGIGLYFGAPFIVAHQFGQQSGSNAAIIITLQSARIVAIFLFLPAVGLIIRDIIVRITFALARPICGKATEAKAGQTAALKRASYPLWAKCWQMPYCSEFVRRVCPAWEKKKSCWKINRGCQCDDSTLLRAMGASNQDQKQRKEINSQVSGKRVGAFNPSQPRQLCKTCAIYLEHQRQKFKIVSALIIPTVIAIIGGLAELLKNSLREALMFAERVMQFASFEPQKSVSYGWAKSGSDIAYLQWLFVVWVCIITMSYALQLVEYCVFKLKL